MSGKIAIDKKELEALHKVIFEAYMFVKDGPDQELEIDLYEAVQNLDGLLRDDK